MVSPSPGGIERGVSILGREFPGLLADHVTVDMAAEIIKSSFPEDWKAINTKIIEAPGSHYGFKAVAVALSCACITAQLERKQFSSANNIAAIASIMQRHDYPVYYVSKPLIEALLHSSPPEGKTWNDIKLPFPGLMFMLPRMTLFEPDGAEIPLIGIARMEKGEILIAPAGGIAIRPWDEARMSAFWTVRHCLETQDVTFPPTQPLEPEPGWIEAKTQEFRHLAQGSNTWTCWESGGTTAQFSSYLTGLIANLILVMLARPQLVEPGEPTGKRHPKTGLRIHRPTFLGRKYEVVRKQSHKGPAQAHFTELDWRCGHFRDQHYGPGGQEVKNIWIEPYIAHVRGLQKAGGKA
jgi:hypothetical protein